MQPVTNPKSGLPKLPQTVSIRRSLLANLVPVIVLLGAAVFATTFLAARQSVQLLSRALIQQSLEHTDERLRRFFDPVRRDLELVRKWGQLGQFSLEQPLDEQHLAGIDHLLVPVLEEAPQLSAVIIADSRGREYMLHRNPAGWSVREMRRDERGDEAHFWKWSAQQPRITTEQAPLDYDPRTRPWFTSAAEALPAPGSNEDPPIQWTAPYTFFTAKAPGLTASAAYRNAQGVTTVVGIDLLLTDISQYTTQLQVSQRGKVFVLTESKQLVGLPAAPEFEDMEGRRQALLKTPAELGIPEVAQAVGQLKFDADREPVPQRFTSGGETWWGELRPFRLSPKEQLWIGVVIPEADLLGDLSRQRVLIVLVTLAVLGLAIWRAVVLARRFSQPIESLVRQSDRISQGDLELADAVESAVTEVRHLADAQERMRTALRSLLKIERDLQVARRIQQATFPDRLPAVPGFEIDGWSEPAEETGGDTYDVIGYAASDTEGDSVRLSTEHADRVVMLLADATGHGIGPALSVTQIRAMLRMAVRMREDLLEFAHFMNEQLCADLPGDRFITAWLGELDATHHTLRSFSAGQGPILHFHAAGKTFDEHIADTLPFGVLEDLDVPQVEPFQLLQGDIVAVVSDGIIEAANPAGEMFGVDRTKAVITEHCGQSVSRILAAMRDAVNDFAAGRPADDDRTAVIIKRTK